VSVLGFYILRSAALLGGYLPRDGKELFAVGQDRFLKHLFTGSHLDLNRFPISTASSRSPTAIASKGESVQKAR
jgi:hypothetical protein